MAADAGHVEIVRILLDHPGINTSVASTKDGHTAISAVANSHHEIVRLLEQFEARGAAVELDALTTTLPDPKGPHDPQKGRSDSLNYTLFVYFNALDLPTGDGKD